MQLQTLWRSSSSKFLESTLFLSRPPLKPVVSRKCPAVIQNFIAQQSISPISHCNKTERSTPPFPKTYTRTLIFYKTSQKITSCTDFALSQSNVKNNWREDPLYIDFALCGKPHSLFMTGGYNSMTYQQRHTEFGYKCIHLYQYNFFLMSLE